MFERFMGWIGYGLCHQLPERSFFGGGVQVPVCARDTGIYVGFVISLIVLAVLHRATRPSEFPRARVWIAAFAFIAFMAWDGATSYAGLRATTNLMRLVSGLGTGYAVAVILYPILNEEIWRTPGLGRPLDSAQEFFVWLATLPAAVFVVWFVGPLVGVVYPAFVALSIVATLSAINLVMVAMLPWFDRRASRWTDLIVPSLLAVALAFVEIGASAALRSILGIATSFVAS